MTFTNEDLFNICIQILKDWIPAPGLRINSFVVVDQAPDLRTNSFGKTYTDFLNGRFWARDWVNEGAEPGNIYATYPALFLEPQNAQLFDPESESANYTFTFLVVDKINCDSCPNDQLRSGDRVQDYTRIMLRNFIKELSSYELVNYDLGDGPADYWASAGRLEYLQAEGLISGYTSAGGDIFSLLEQGPINFVQWGNLPDMRGTYADLTFNYCENIAAGFNYIDKATITKAVTKSCC
jgi:hypothetical protein